MTWTALSFQWGSGSDALANHQRFGNSPRRIHQHGTVLADRVQRVEGVRAVVEGGQPDDALPLAARRLPHVACKSPLVSKHTTDPRK